MQSSSDDDLREAIAAHVAEQLRTLGPRPSTVHDHPCVNCPSAHDCTLDPEMTDLLAAPRATRAEAAFRCAWRPSKLCRGYVDVMDLDVKDFGS
jgi:hypothetical protein